MTASGRLLAGPEAPAPEHAAVFLVGGYDGSGNYGDMLQLQATLELLALLGPGVTAIPVIELECRRIHDELVAASPQLGAAPVCYFDSGGADLADGLSRLSLAPQLAFTGLYLYGGGYLNASWGPRKLAMAQAVVDTARAAGLAPPWSISSGLQVEAGWAAGLEGDQLELLRRLELFGVRDERSLPAFLDGTRALLTGDDAVGVLAARAGAAPAAHPNGALRVNVHLQDASWVTDDPSAHVDFVAELLERLEDRAGVPLEIQPVIAYEDRRITERTLVARLTAAPALASRIAGEPLVLRPGDLAPSLDVLARARLTLSCSYHVALTSSLLGVPAALLAGNPYHEQKAAGLSAQFGLPAAFTVDPHGPPDAAAGLLADALRADHGGERLAGALNAGGLRSAMRRRETELQILARLSAAIVGALTARGGAQASGRTGELMDRLALLRIDHGELLTGFERLRARQAEQDAQLAERAALIDERAAEYHALWDELQRYATDKENLLARCAELEVALVQERAVAERIRRAHATAVRSLSWRATAPLRRGARLLRRRRRPR